MPLMLKTAEDPDSVVRIVMVRGVPPFMFYKTSTGCF